MLNRTSIWHGKPSGMCKPRTPTFFDWNLGVVTGSVGSGFMVCGPLPFPRGSCQSVGFLLYLGASGAQLRKEKEVVQQKGWAL